jgi:CheY-like chemotaxis protein
MGGVIEVSSMPQVGTVADLWLPSQSMPPRVLIVDDDDAVRTAVCRMAKRLGYTVIDAASGSAALEQLAREHVDIVLSDVVMPHMDGGQFVAALRAQGGRQPVVFMSGYSTIDEVAMERLGGIEGFIAKPFTARDLDAMLQRTTGAAAA